MLERKHTSESLTFGDLSQVQIDSNLNLFKSVIESLTDTSKSNALMTFINALGETLALSPASSKLEYHSCYPGGFIEHSLRVLEFAAQELNMTLSGKTRYYNEVNIDSLKIASLFHDIGKVAFIDSDDKVYPYYVVNESDSTFYAKKIGKLYEVNPLLKDVHMSVPHRGLYMLQRFGVRLTHEEFLAILLHDGPYEKMNDYYSMKELDIVVLVHHADLLATRYEKDLYLAGKTAS